MPKTSFSEAQRQKYLAAIERLRNLPLERKKRENAKYTRNYVSRPRLASYDVYDPTQDVLETLQATPGLTIGQIGECLEMKPTRLKHWILKMLGKGLIQKVVYRDRYRVNRYYTADHDISEVPRENPNIPTNAILHSLRNGPKSLKQLRRAVGKDSQDWVDSCIEHLLKQKRVVRVTNGVYQLAGKGEANPHRKILNLLEKSPGTTFPELVAHLGMNQQTIRNYLSALAEKGEIKRVIVRGSRIFFRYFLASYPIEGELLEKPGPTHAVLNFLQARPKGSITEIWEATGISQPVIRSVIQNLVKQGILTRVSKGVYSVREKQNDY